MDALLEVASDDASVDAETNGPPATAPARLSASSAAAAHHPHDRHRASTASTTTIGTNGGAGGGGYDGSFALRHIDGRDGGLEEQVGGHAREAGGASGERGVREPRWRNHVAGRSGCLHRTGRSPCPMLYGRSPSLACAL